MVSTVDKTDYVRGDVGALIILLVLVFQSLDALGVDKAAMAELILDAANKMEPVEDESPESLRATLLRFHGLLTGAKPLDTLFH